MTTIVGRDARFYLLDELGAHIALDALEAPLLLGGDFSFEVELAPDLAAIAALEAELKRRHAPPPDLAPRNRKERRAQASRERRRR